MRGKGFQRYWIERKSLKFLALDETLLASSPDSMAAFSSSLDLDLTGDEEPAVTWTAAKRQDKNR